MYRNRPTTVILLLVLAALGACMDNNPPPGRELKTTLAATTSTDADNEFIKPFKNAGSSALTTFALSAQQLNTRTREFLDNSNGEQLVLLQQQWLDTHRDWHRAAFYLQAGMPSAQWGSELGDTCRSLHQPYLQAGYLDSIEGYPASGLVNDINLSITPQTLREQHQRFDDSEASTGLNAMEFEIWYHQAEDFGSKATDTSQQQLPEQRRRALLALLGKLIEADAQQLLNAWSLATIDKLQAKNNRQLYQLLAIAELQFLLDSLAEPHTPFSQDTGWQLDLLENLQAQATVQGDDSTRQQLDSLLAQLTTSDAPDKTALAAALLELLDILQAASKPALDE